MKTKLTEGSYDEFIDKYASEIAKLKVAMKRLSQKVAKDQELGYPVDALEEIGKIYDPPVLKSIERWIHSPSEMTVRSVAQLGIDINNKYGTEMRQVINALNDLLSDYMEDEEDDDYEESVQSDLRRKIKESNETALSLNSTEKCWACSKQNDQADSHLCAECEEDGYWIDPAGGLHDPDEGFEDYASQYESVKKLVDRLLG